jgi:hypothetical protein
MIACLDSENMLLLIVGPYYYSAVKEENQRLFETRHSSTDVILHGSRITEVLICAREYSNNTVTDSTRRGQ